MNDDAERALAKFGAEVVRRWWLYAGTAHRGFVVGDGARGVADLLDEYARMHGLLRWLSDCDAEWAEPAPGIVEATWRLTEEGHG